MPVDVEQLLIAEGAVFMFPAQIAVLFADGEERGDGEVRHAEAGQHFADNVPARFRGADGSGAPLPIILLPPVKTFPEKI